MLRTFNNDLIHRLGVTTLIGMVILLGVTASSAKDAASGSRSDLHGPLEYLRHSLILSAEDARLIASAERQLQLGETGAAFVALQAVFASEHDSFTPASRGRLRQRVR